MRDMLGAGLDTRLYLDLDAENHAKGWRGDRYPHNNGGFSLNAYALDVLSRRAVS